MCRGLLFINAGPVKNRWLSLSSSAFIPRLISPAGFREPGTWFHWLAFEVCRISSILSVKKRLNLKCDSRLLLSLQLSLILPVWFWLTDSLALLLVTRVSVSSKVWWGNSCFWKHEVSLYFTLVLNALVSYRSKSLFRGIREDVHLSPYSFALPSYESRGGQLI